VQEVQFLKIFQLIKYAWDHQ